MELAVRRYLQGQLRHEEIDSDERDRLENLGLWPDGLVIDVDGRVRMEIDCIEIGDDWYCDDDSRICTCDACDCLVLLDDVSTVDEDQHWCESCLEDAHYYDSEYHSEPEQSADGVSGYHDHDVDPAQPHTLPADVLGIELESYWSDCTDLTSWMEDEGMDVAGGWKAERDGSLDDDHGIEIVASPIPYSEIIADDSPWRPVFARAKACRAKAWDVGPGYGLHISVNAARMSEDHRAKFSRLINGNRALCECIAGRSESQYQRYHCQSKAAAAKGTEKYLACATRSESRIEVRIFRASWCWDRFVRNCQFVESVRRYTERVECSDEPAAHDYLDWLASEPEWQSLCDWICDHLAIDPARTAVLSAAE